MTAPATRKSSDRQRRSPAQIDGLIVDQLARCDAPVSAYDLAERCQAAGAAIVPNQVYRTLARLMETGRVHRLESLSAYVLKNGTSDAWLICDCCHKVCVQPAPDTVELLRRCAATHEFRVSRLIIELHGRCASCMPHAGDGAISLPTR